MGEALETIGRKTVAVAILVGAAFVLWKVVVGAILAAAWFVVLIAVVIAVLWALRALW